MKPYQNAFRKHCWQKKKTKRNNVEICKKNGLSPPRTRNVLKNQKCVNQKRKKGKNQNEFKNL